MRLFIERIYATLKNSSYSWKLSYQLSKAYIKKSYVISNLKSRLAQADRSVVDQFTGPVNTWIGNTARIILILLTRLAMHTYSF